MESENTPDAAPQAPRPGAAPGDGPGPTAQSDTPTGAAAYEMSPPDPASAETSFAGTSERQGDEWSDERPVAESDVTTGAAPVAFPPAAAEANTGATGSGPAGAALPSGLASDPVAHDLSSQDMPLLNLARSTEDHLPTPPADEDAAAAAPATPQAPLVTSDELPRPTHPALVTNPDPGDDADDNGNAARERAMLTGTTVGGAAVAASRDVDDEGTDLGPDPHMGLLAPGGPLPPAGGGHGADPALDGRREFLKKAVAVTVGGAIVGVPAAAGVSVLLDPLARKGSAADFTQVAALAAVPPDGTVVKFSVLADKSDAWNHYPNVPIGAVYVKRDAAAPGGVKAFNVVCPHAGCAVDARPDGKFLCPCHKSWFNPDGSIVPGQCVSPRGLDELEVDQEALKQGVVRIKFQNFRAASHEKIPVT